MNLYWPVYEGIEAELINYISSSKAGQIIELEREE